MTQNREIRERLKREIDRMSSKELEIASKSEESFFDWLVKTIQQLFGAIVDGIKEFFEWLFETLTGNKKQ